MRTKLLSALALITPMVIAVPALALDTSRTYTVHFDGETVGHWGFRGKVKDTGDACQYTVKWSNLAGPPLGATHLCKVDELKAGDNFDCMDSSHNGVNTV